MCSERICVFQLSLKESMGDLKTDAMPSSQLSEGSYNEALKPLSWIIGCWTATEASVFYPTMDTLSYIEEMEFLPNEQQPVLQYKSQTYHSIKKNLMHTESGYLRILPGTKTLAFMVSHNFGVSELSEGEVGDDELQLQSKYLTRMSFAKGAQVIEVHRHLCLKDQVLYGKVKMATTTQPLQDHLSIIYKKKN